MPIEWDPGYFFCFLLFALFVMWIVDRFVDWVRNGLQ